MVNGIPRPTELIRYWRIKYGKEPSNWKQPYIFHRLYWQQLLTELSGYGTEVYEWTFNVILLRLRRFRGRMFAVILTCVRRWTEALETCFLFVLLSSFLVLQSTINSLFFYLYLFFIYAFIINVKIKYTCIKVWHVCWNHFFLLLQFCDKKNVTR